MNSDKVYEPFESLLENDYSNYNVEETDHPLIYRAHGMLDGEGGLSMEIVIADTFICIQFYNNAVAPWDEVTIQFFRQARSREDARALATQLMAGLWTTERLVALGFEKDSF